MSSSRFLVVAGALCGVQLAAPAAAHAQPFEEAERQLSLAEDDYAAGRFEAAASGARSAFRLDGTLHGALVVQGLALRELGQAQEATAMLRTYLTIRQGLEVDPRAAATLVLLEAELERANGTFNVSSALAAAEEALLQLETGSALAYIAAVQAERDLKPQDAQRALSLEAQARWSLEERVEARALWRRLFARYPRAVVDPRLPPSAITAMAEEQAAVRASQNPPHTNTGSARPEALLLGIGGTTAALGFAVAGGSYGSQIESFPGLMESGEVWDAGIGGYRAAWTTERVGVAVGGTGVALLTAGLVGLIVREAQKKKVRR